MFNLLFVGAHALMNESVVTPFGRFPADCVRHVPSGARLRELDDGSVEVRVGEDTQTFAAKPHCVEHVKSLTQVRDGWLDYVDEYTTPLTVGFFNGTYTVPEEPPSGMDGQTLFYFIGTENMKDSESITILQPVLTWANGHDKWNMASWNCCPAGEATTSDFLLDLEPGTTAYGYINITETEATIVSEYAGKSVNLVIEGEMRVFDWLDVTLEVYGVDGCDDFAASDATISAMTIQDSTGAAFVPDWEDATGSTDCEGSQTFSADTWTVSHSTTAELKTDGPIVHRRRAPINAV